MLLVQVFSCTDVFKFEQKGLVTGSIDLRCSTGKVVEVESKCVGSLLGATPHLGFGWLMILCK